MISSLATAYPHRAPASAKLLENVLTTAVFLLFAAAAAKMEKYAARPEVAYFMEHFVPSFSLTLDELKK